MFFTILNQIRAWLYNTCEECGMLTSEATFTETCEERLALRYLGVCFNSYHFDSVRKLNELLDRTNDDNSNLTVR